MTLQRRKKLFFILFPAISVLLISAAVIYRRESFNTESDAGEVDTPVQISGPNQPPQVVSVHPNVVTEGVYFEYHLKVIDPDTEVENIGLRILRGPGWLQLGEGLSINGTPMITDTNVHSIELELDDGYNIVNEQFYILINEADE